MALNFPTDPQENDVYTSNGTSWRYNGTAWDLIGASGAVVSPSNNFGTISVDGQQDVVADSTNDALTLIAGDNVTITTDAAGDSVTINSTATGGGGGGETQDLFATFAADTGSTTANSPTDQLTITGGTDIATSISGDILTINYDGGAASTFATLTDVSSAALTVDKIYEPAIAMLRVDNVGTSAYTFNSHYTGNNPNIYALAGTTIAFDLDAIGGHPFQIQDPTTSPYNTGLVHVSSSGVVSTGSDANGKDSGTLYWRIPETLSGTYRYQCLNHVAMVGAITIKRLSII